ncbi:MAG: replication factor C large subunit [Candidatus Nanoarchaeia archaeon]
MEYCPWTKKYAPKKISELVGQQEVLLSVLRYLANYPKVRKPAVLLYGPTGVGKTALVKAIAAEKNYELIELNASDCRSAETIKANLLPAVTQRSLWGNKKLILVDEIEGIHGQSDRGGIQALLEVVEKSSYPIIFTTIDAFDEKFKSLRSHCEILEMKPLDVKDIIKKLQEIVTAEKIKAEQGTLQTIALHANGDLRAAINDLQMLAEKDKILTKEKMIFWGREQEESLSTLLRFVFKSFDTSILIRTFDYIENELEEIIFWLDQNLPNEYDLKDLFTAYSNLSSAEIFLQRIKKRQHWRFFVYAKYLGLVGVQQAKSNVKRNPLNYSRPELLLKMFIASAKKRKAQALAEQYADYFHTSSKRLLEAFWPFYNFASNHSQVFGEFEEIKS